MAEAAEGIYDYINDKIGDAQAEAYLIAIHECLSMLAGSAKLAISAQENDFLSHQGFCTKDLSTQDIYGCHVNENHHKFLLVNTNPL